jgi:uncharacterized protein YbjQ (UPF0145 family)
MLVVTTENIPGYTIKEVKGACFGLIVRSRGLGADLIASLKSLVGGEIKQFTVLLEDLRKAAMDRLVANAQAMGANAVVMVRFDSGAIGKAMGEIIAYGTAVVVEKVSE